MTTPEIDLLGQYLRLHLIGSAGGLSLFGRGSAFPDADAREALHAIREELVDERRWLQGLAERLGHRRAVVGETAAWAGERIGRLKPNGHLTKRTALTDVVDLEAMLGAVRVKQTGWQALLACAHRLDQSAADDLRHFHDRAAHQVETLQRLHEDAARRAFADRL